MNFVCVSPSRVEFCLFQVFADFFKWVYQVEYDVNKNDRSCDCTDDQDQAHDSGQESFEFADDKARIHTYYYVVASACFKRREQHFVAWRAAG